MKILVFLSFFFKLPFGRRELNEMKIIILEYCFLLLFGSLIEEMKNSFSCLGV